MFSPCSAKRRASDKDLPVAPSQCLVMSQPTKSPFPEIIKYSVRLLIFRSIGKESVICNYCAVLPEGKKNWGAIKGQIEPKTDLCAADSPKKRTNEFVFWENLRRAYLLSKLTGL